MLSGHLAVSVGWIGAAAAYASLDAAATFSDDAQTLRAAYIGMGVIAPTVIVPLAVATLISGIVMSLGTKWGLLQHWWVVVSLVLTVFAAGVLLMETRTIRELALAASDDAATSADLRALGGTLLHSVGGTVLLLVALVLNVYKPPGLTPYGWRKQRRREGRPGRR